ncbi:MAG: hypothetical protein WBQ94_04390 [Terracidiphilus sp.]
MTTNLEKYLAGEPLNEELALLKAGKLPLLQEPGNGAWLADVTRAAEVSLDEIRRPLTREERAALREMRTGGGWIVLQKLLKRATIGHTEAAVRASEDDPLGKREEIAQLWLTLKVWKRLVADMNLWVEFEMQGPGTEGLGTREGAHEAESAVEGT